MLHVPFEVSDLATGLIWSLSLLLYAALAYDLGGWRGVWDTAPVRKGTVLAITLMPWLCFRTFSAEHWFIGAPIPVGAVIYLLHWRPKLAAARALLQST